MQPDVGRMALGPLVDCAETREMVGGEMAMLTVCGKQLVL